MLVVRLCVPASLTPQGSLILKILRGKYPPLTGYSKELTAVVKGCLTQVCEGVVTDTA